MYQIAQGTTHGLQDANHFIDIINTLNQYAVPEARSLFDFEKEILVTRAPGRLDVMGGIADYSGSLVLQLPLKKATFAGIQLIHERKLRIVSLDVEARGKSSYFEMNLDDFQKRNGMVSYEFAQQYFRKNPARDWAAYAAGVFLVLMKERNVVFQNGACILIHSNVPQGKGVSSSAALEVVVMTAVLAAFRINVLPQDVAVLCQKVENLVVGAPCGIMDQMTAVCGKAGQLLSLLCQPAVLLDPIAIPDHICFWGIDSGVSHSVSAIDYISVRIGAFMGYRIIAGHAGSKVTSIKNEHRVQIDDSNWTGYLADISPSVYESHYKAYLPEKIKGSIFVDRYHGTTDNVTEIDPNVIYPVAKPTAHPIYEHFRVRTFAELLAKNCRSDRSLAEMGELMYQSHNSYSSCGLGSEGTDRLVELARELGPGKGVFGAKITGGGSGGTVAILGKADAYQSVEMIAEKYAEETGSESKIFSGSSMGAHDFGYIILRKA